MSYYADPTANRAMGNINRQFSKIEKRVARLWQLVNEGKLSPEAFEKEVAQYKGIFKQAVINGMKPKKPGESPSAESGELTRRG